MTTKAQRRPATRCSARRSRRVCEAVRGAGPDGRDACSSCLAEHRVAGRLAALVSFQPRLPPLFAPPAPCPCCRVPTVPGFGARRCWPQGIHRRARTVALRRCIMPRLGVRARTSSAPRRGGQWPQHSACTPSSGSCSTRGSARWRMSGRPGRDGPYAAARTVSSRPERRHRGPRDLTPPASPSSSAASRTNSDGWRSNGTSSVPPGGSPSDPRTPPPPRPPGILVGACQDERLEGPIRRLRTAPAVGARRSTVPR